ncbi:MAG: glycosyltransferase family 4 protein [Candidatus Woykebacteria bacterium]
MKKVVMVVNNPFTNDSRVVKEATSLVNKGFDVTVFATKKSGLPNSESVRDIKVERISSRYDFRLKPWKYFTELLPAKNKLINEKADVYHAHDLDTLLITCQVAKKVGARVIYDSHELFTERYFKKGPPLLSDLGSLIYKQYLKLIESSLIGKVDWVIAVNDSIANELKKRYKINNVTVVLNSQPSSENKFSEVQNLRRILNLKASKKIVIYQGFITSIRGLDKLVIAAEYLEKNTELVLIGEGDFKKQLEYIVGKKKLQDKVKFLPLVSLEDIRKITLSADLGVIPYRNFGLNNFYSTPNKLFEYIAAGIPVVASNFPELRKIILDNKIGNVFDPENPIDIADKINTILSDKKGLEELKKNVKVLFETRLNWKIEEKKLLEVYKILDGIKN